MVVGPGERGQVELDSDHAARTVIVEEPLDHGTTDPAAATGHHVRAGHVSGTSVAANAGEVDADRDRVRLREFRGVTEPRADLLAVLLQPRRVVRHRRVVVQDLGGAGEYDDVAAAAVAVEVERDQRLSPDVREPFGLRPVVGQQAVAAVPEKPDRVRLRDAVTPDRRQPIVISSVSRRRTRSP